MIRGPRRWLARGALAVATALPLCGCSLFVPALPASPRGMLTALPSDLPRQEGAAPASATLLVAAPHTQLEGAAG